MRRFASLFTRRTPPPPPPPARKIGHNWVTGRYNDGVLFLTDVAGDQQSFQIGTNPETQPKRTTAGMTSKLYTFGNTMILLTHYHQFGIRQIDIRVGSDLVYSGSLLDETIDNMESELDKSIPKEEDPINVEGGKKNKKKNKKKTIRRSKKKRTTRKIF